MSKLVLDFLNLNIPESADSSIKFAYRLLIISIVFLYTFLNLIGSLITMILTQNYGIKINNKFIIR